MDEFKLDKGISYIEALLFEQAKKLTFTTLAKKRPSYFFTRYPL